MSRDGTTGELCAALLIVRNGGSRAAFSTRRRHTASSPRAWGLTTTMNEAKNPHGWLFFFTHMQVLSRRPRRKMRCLCGRSHGSSLCCLRNGIFSISQARQFRASCANESLFIYQSGNPNGARLAVLSGAATATRLMISQQRMWMNRFTSCRARSVFGGKRKPWQLRMACQNSGDKTNNNSRKSCGVTSKPNLGSPFALDFWASKPTWRRASVNTLRCLVGCTAGDFSAMWYLQASQPDLGMGAIMAISSTSGCISTRKTPLCAPERLGPSCYLG